MYHYYYVNNNQTLNPGLHHEVHTKEHAEQLGIRSAQYVGYFESEVEAVAHAKKIYLDADGCAICCPKAHRSRRVVLKFCSICCARLTSLGNISVELTAK